MQTRQERERRYLKAPYSYRSASDEEKAEICNGAGPKGYGWMVFDTLWLLSITEAANIHDWMYQKGRTEKDKKEADMTFLDNMFEIINNETSKVPVIGFFLRILRHRRALVYYEAVKEFGNSAFWKGKSNGCDT